MPKDFKEVYERQRAIERTGDFVARARKSKYRATKTWYNGVCYDSKREAHWAGVFDTLRKAGDPAERVVSVERQVPFSLCEVPGEGITYRVDFKVGYADGSTRYYEVKGYETPEWKMKMKLIKEKHPEITVEVLR